MNKERLLELANYLDTVKPEKFNLETFAGYYGEDDGDVGKDITKDICEELLDTNCGTTACAVGHLPLMKPDIFKYVVGDYDFWREKYPVEVAYIQDIGLDDTFKSIGYVTSQHYFDLTREEWDFIFSAEKYLPSNSNPSNVARRIRMLCVINVDVV